jgi:hypothetical protein
MSMTDATCVLCSKPAKMEDADRGNCTYFACTNASCGDYEISKRAARQLRNNIERKGALCEMVSRANQNGQVIEICIASDGVMQASFIKRD